MAVQWDGRCDTPARTQVGAKDFDQAISELEELNWYLCRPLAVMYNSSRNKCHIHSQAKVGRCCETTPDKYHNTGLLLWSIMTGIG